MFMTLVVIHELGHFIVAKKSWVKVEEFGIGIPPKIMTLWTDKSWTNYTLNLIPLGWFVRLKGEDPSDPATFQAKDSFIKAKIRKKILILLAGVTMNTIFAWLVFTTIFALGTKPIQIIPDNIVKSDIKSFLTPTKYFLYSEWFITEDTEKKVVIEDLYEDGLATKMGLLTWDTILSINQTTINTRNIEKTLKDNINKTFSLNYQRKGKKATMQITCPKDDCLLGITYTASIDPNAIKEIKFPILLAMKYGAKEIVAQTKMTLWFLKTFGKNIATFKRANIKESLHKMTWPAGAIKFGEMILQSWWRKLYLGFAGMISLALAIFNVLPIPALDGGRLLGVLIQRIGRLKEETYFNIEWYINLVFFVLLMGMGIYVLFQDLIRVRGFHVWFLS